MQHRQYQEIHFPARLLDRPQQSRQTEIYCELLLQTLLEVLFLLP
jgi:hypothetical protein